MKDIPEIWEISYDPDAKPIFDGYVHDYKMGEGVALAGYLNPVARCSKRRWTISSSIRNTTP